MANKKVVTITINADGKEVRETTKDIERLGDGLHDLDVRQAREAQETLKNLGHVDLNGTIKDAQELKRTLAGIDDSQLKDAQKATRELGADADKTSNTYRDAAGRMRDANGKFVSSAKEAKNAADNLENGVRKASGGFDRLGETASAVGGKLKNAGQSIREFGTTLTAAATLPIVGLGAAAVKTFADVELVVARISTIKPEIDTTRVREALNDLSTRVPQAADALGDGLYNIFSSINVSQAEGLKLLESFSKGATAAETDAKTFGTSVLGVMNAYKMSVKDAAHISDVFFNTVNLGVVNGAELANELGSVTTAAKQAGVSFDELGALIVGVTKEGGSASENINRLNNFLQKLPTSGADIKKLLNVDVKDGDKFRPVIDVLTDFKTSYDKLSQTKQAEVLQKIFPDSQAREGAAKLLSQLDAVKEALEVNKTSAGAAEAAYQKIAATASVQFSLLKNTSVAILSELGSAILPVLQPLVIWLAQSLVPSVKQAVETFKTWSPQMQQVAVAVAAFIASLGPALVVIATIISVVATLVEGIGLIVGAIAALGGVGPAILIIGAAFAQVLIIAGAFAAYAFVIYEAWQSNFGNIQNVVSEFINLLTLSFSSLMGVIQPAIDEVTSYAVEGFSQIKQWWAENGNEISKAAETVLNLLLDAFRAILSTIISLWETHGENIKTIVSETWSVVKTVISGSISVIGNLIAILANVINGNWSAAWENVKNIVVTVLYAIAGLIRSSDKMLLAALKIVLNAIFNIADWLSSQSTALGQSIVYGIINGMSSGVGSVALAAWDLGKRLINSLKESVDSHSPSREAMKIGEFVGDGLAIGLLNKVALVKKTAKKLGDELLKELRDSVKDFSKLAGASPETVDLFNQTERIKKAKDAQTEIMKLRQELGLNLWKNMPKTVNDTEAELHYLQAQKKAAEDFQKSLEDVAESVAKTTEMVEAEKVAMLKAFEEKKVAIQQNSEFSLFKLQEEIDLLGVTDEMEKIRIQNGYDLKRLREQLMNDGFESDQIDEIVSITEAEQKRLLELQNMLRVRKEMMGADKLNNNLGDQLQSLLNGGKELSEYEKTLRNLNENYKNIPVSQREQILQTAAQIDAQKEFNEQYKQTYDYVHNLIDVLTEKGTSFGDKLKSIFSGIFNSFKKMLVDMAAQAATSAIFGKSTASSGSNGFNIGNLLNGLFGRSSNGSFTTPPFVSNFSNSSGNSTSSQISNLAEHISSTLSRERTAALESAASGALDRGSASGGAISSITRTASGGGFSIGGLASGLGAMAPLLGLSLGSSIGGTSLTGNILGGAGGLLGGLTAMSFLAPTMFATMLGAGGLGLSAGAIAAIPIVGAIAAPLLLLGGWLIGRSKQRRQEEIQRTQVINDAFGQLDEILKQVNSDKIDGQSGIAQANSIRQQYLQQVSQLKDTKTRNIALKDVSRLDPKIESIRQAAAAQDTRKNIAEKWIPAYANGTYMDAGFIKQYGDFKRRNGLLPGAFTGVDNLPSLLAAGEMVLNPTQQFNVIRNAGGVDVFAGAGIPNYEKSSEPSMPKFATGVNLNNQTFASTSNSNQQNQPTIIQVDEMTFDVDAEKFFLKGARSNKGGEVIFQVVKSKLNLKG